MHRRHSGERKEDVKLEAVDLSKCPLGHWGSSDVNESSTNGCNNILVMATLSRNTQIMI